MKRALLSLLSLIVVAALCSACDPARPYAAIVDGHVIPASVINDEIHAIVSNPAYKSTLDQELSAGTGAGGIQPNGANTVNATYVAQLVYYRVLVQLIDKTIAENHIVVTPADTAHAQQTVQQDLNDPVLYNSLPKSYIDYLVSRQAKLSAVLAWRDSPQAEQAYYNAHQSDYVTYCVQHILVQQQQQAEDIYNQLQAGGDFAALAKADSIDPGSAGQGGSLGCNSAASLQQFIAPFRDAVFSLPVGVVSQPVQSQYGWHLIEVTSKTQSTFDQSKSDISQKLSSPTDFFTTELANAKITINPRYGEYIPGDPTSGQTPQIVPWPPNALPSGKSSSSGSSFPGLGGGGGSVSPDSAPVQ